MAKKAQQTQLKRSLGFLTKALAAKTIGIKLEKLTVKKKIIRKYSLESHIDPIKIIKEHSSKLYMSDDDDIIAETQQSLDKFMMLIGKLSFFVVILMQRQQYLSHTHYNTFAHSLGDILNYNQITCLVKDFNKLQVQQKKEFTWFDFFNFMNNYFNIDFYETLPLFLSIVTHSQKELTYELVDEVNQKKIQQRYGFYESSLNPEAFTKFFFLFPDRDIHAIFNINDKIFMQSKSLQNLANFSLIFDSESLQNSFKMLKFEKQKNKILLQKLESLQEDNYLNSLFNAPRNQTMPESQISNYQLDLQATFDVQPNLIDIMPQIYQNELDVFNSNLKKDLNFKQIKQQIKRQKEMQEKQFLKDSLNQKIVLKLHYLHRPSLILCLIIQKQSLLLNIPIQNLNISLKFDKQYTIEEEQQTQIFISGLMIRGGQLDKYGLLEQIPPNKQCEQKMPIFQVIFEEKQMHRKDFIVLKSYQDVYFNLIADFSSQKRYNARPTLMSSFLRNQLIKKKKLQQQNKMQTEMLKEYMPEALKTDEYSLFTVKCPIYFDDIDDHGLKYYIIFKSKFDQVYWRGQNLAVFLKPLY